MEVLSARVLELYRMLSIEPSVMTKDMGNVCLDEEDYHTDEQLIDFLNGKEITNPSPGDKPPAMDGS